jgi:hypothetical protein
MKENKAISKHIIFWVIILLLIMPLIQKHTGIFLEVGLKGAIVAADKPKLSMKGWFDAGYQEKMETYLNESFGLRNYFVRFNNQIAFSLFRKASANGVIIGKQNYLYEENYIRAYYGMDFIGEDSILHRMQRLKSIQDTLEKLNKHILIVFAPGKGSFYPEFFPDKYKIRKGKTNYEVHLKYANELGINYIDFNKYFMDHKSSFPYPIYPKHGIHWSIYGACLVADSLIRYIEKMIGYQFADFTLNEIKIRKAENADYDIADGMNLLFELKHQEMAYPEYSITTDTSKTKPSLLVISDSFYWILYGIDIWKAFSPDHFWYYNNEIFPDSYAAPKKVSEVNLSDEIGNHNIIILMASEATLPALGWGFIENASELLRKN